MKILLLLISAIAVQGQPEYRLSQNNPDLGYALILGYTGDNVIYVCRALSLQPVSPAVSVASATNAAAAVLTVSAGHGFDLNSKPSITIIGGTGGWAAINGTRIATPLNTTTFSIPVNSSAFGALAGTVTYTSRAPLISNPVWSVMSLAYSGANLISTTWAGGSPQVKTTSTGAPSSNQ